MVCGALFFKGVSTNVWTNIPGDASIVVSVRVQMDEFSRPCGPIELRIDPTGIYVWVDSL